LGGKIQRSGEIGPAAGDQRKASRSVTTAISKRSAKASPQNKKSKRPGQEPFACNHESGRTAKRRVTMDSLDDGAIAQCDGRQLLGAAIFNDDTFFDEGESIRTSREFREFMAKR
jgi:hypothetical protein